MLVPLSACINITPESLLSAPKSQIHNVSRFLYHTVPPTGVYVVVRIRPSQKQSPAKLQMWTYFSLGN